MMRILVALGASALFVAPFVAAAPAAARTCPYGTVATYNGICTNGMPVGGTAAPSPPAAAGAPGGVVPGNVSSPAVVAGTNSVGSVDGIPCTPQHQGTCIGLAQSGQ